MISLLYDHSHKSPNMASPKFENDEKLPLTNKSAQIPIPTSQPKPKSKRPVALVLILCYILSLALYDVQSRFFHKAQAVEQDWKGVALEARCPAQPKGLSRGKKWDVPEGYEQEVAERLSRAVQIAVSTDWGADKVLMALMAEIMNISGILE